MADINATHRLRDLDPGFLEKYNLVGPRYTSYPTAPEWKAETGSAELRAHLLGVKDEWPISNSITSTSTSTNTISTAGFGEQRSPFRKPLSIYIHLPFCIEHCTFCACNVIVSPKMELVSDPYLNVLEREVALWAGAVDTARPVAQFHWGGGTPTYLTPPQLRRVHAMVADRFELAPDAEQSIEVHVTWTSDAHLLTLAGLGFNRISMGVQDFNPETQAAINRRQSFARTKHIVQLARSLGFKDVNFDLVYGLPLQTPQTFAETIERVIELRPDRLAVYSFAYIPEAMPHQRAIDAAALPGASDKLQCFLAAHDRLVAAGYRYIGMDHFALPGSELAEAFDAGTMQRNFMGFTTRAGADLIGMGVSAISSFAGMYAQNVKKLPRYEAAMSAGQFAIERGLRLSADDALRRDVIGALMCSNRVDKHAIEARHGIRFDDYFSAELEALEPLVADGLLTTRGGALELSFLGRLFVRNIAMAFDAYLKRPDSKRRFSRTV